MESRLAWFGIALVAALIVGLLAYGTFMLLGVPGLAAWFIVVCVFLMLVILIQKPKGGGLSGAFGGAGGGSAQAAFGAKTGDVLTWFTVGCFVLFLGLAMGLQWTIRPAHERIIQDITGQSAAEESLDRATGGNLPLDEPDTPDTPDAPATPDAPDTASPVGNAEAPEAAGAEVAVEAETDADAADPAP